MPGIPDKHHLRHGISFVVRIAEEYLLHALEVHQVLDPAGDVDDRAAALAVEHFHVGPFHARAPAGADGLEHRFLCREPAGIMLGRELLLRAVLPFTVGEHPLQKTGMVFPCLVDAVDLDEIYPDSDDHVSPSENKTQISKNKFQISSNFQAHFQTF